MPTVVDRSSVVVAVAAGAAGTGRVDAAGGARRLLGCCESVPFAVPALRAHSATQGQRQCMSVCESLDY